MNNTNYIREIIKYILWGTIFLVPLIFIPSVQEVIEFPKQTLFITLTAIAALLWLIETLIKSKLVYTRNKINLALLALPIVLLVSALLSGDPYGAFVGWGVQISSSVITFAFLSIFVFLSFNVFEGLKDLTKTIFIFLASVFLATLFGFLQLSQIYIFPFGFTETNAFNTIGTANGLGLLAGAALLISMGLIFASSKGTEKIIKIPIIISAVMSFLYLFALDFGPIWIGLTAAVASVLFFGFLRRTSVKLTVLMWWTGLLLVSLLMIFFNPNLSDRIVTPTEVSLNQRTSLGIAGQTLKSNPVFGSGPGTFAYDFSQFKPQSLNNTIFWNVRFSKGSSEFTSSLAMTGILGVAALFFLIGWIGYKSVKRLRTSSFETKTDGLDKKVFESSLLAALGFLTILYFFYPLSLVLWFTLFTLVLFLVMFDKEKGGSEQKEILLEHSPQVSLIVAIVFLTAIVLNAGVVYGMFQRYRAEISYTKGVRTADIVQAQTSLDKATRINPYIDLYWRDLGALTFNRFLAESRQPPSVERDQNIQTFLNQALSATNRASELNPQNSFTWSLRGTIYRNLIGLAQGADSFSINTLQEAIQRDPVNPVLHTELGRAYLAQIDLAALNQTQLAPEQREQLITNAIESFNQAIRLKGDYAPALFQSALLFDRIGERQEAINRMEANKILAPNDTGIAFQLGVLYYKSSNFNQAQAEFERAVALDENFSNARYFLGIILDFRGRVTAAIEQFEKISALNPGNPTVQTILTNLRTGRPALGTTRIGGETFLPLETGAIPIPTSEQQ